MNLDCKKQKSKRLCTSIFKFLKLRKGELLLEDIIFIVLNLIFIAIIVVFLFSKTGSAAVLEEKYAKEIALIIDSLEPISEFEIDVSDAISKSEDSYRDKIITINENTVIVKLRENGGYSYSFFNDVSAVPSRLSETKYIVKIIPKEERL